LPAVRELAQAHFCRHESFHSGEKGFTMAAKTAPKTNVVGDDHPFINRILCNGIRYEEMRGYPKILADSELSRGIRLGIAIFGNQYCDMNFQATRHLPPESLEMLNDSKQQILKQIADWYKSKNLLPETQRQQSAQLTIRLIKEPNRTVRLFISP
jgi:hypothetical protein